MKKLAVLLILITLPLLAWCQEEDKPRNWELNGYLKGLQSLFIFNEAYPEIDEKGQVNFVDTFLVDNLIHNRLNFQWYLSPSFNFKADLRSRIFYGDLVRATPDYGKVVDNANNDYFDLSLVLYDGNSLVVHTMLDRLYFEYSKNDWEIRLGRQRVNWGISTIWNPNDIFNAYDFTDFDYEERPGSDALRIKRFTGFASSIELVVTAFDNWSEARLAAMWKFNKWNYDFQLLAGLVNSDLAIGAGWAGNIKNAGFKGEITYFYPLDGVFPDYENPTDGLAMTFGIDYSFSNSLYLNVGYLYNSNGTTDLTAGSLFVFRLSAKNLYPYRHSVLAQLSYPITPLLNGSLIAVYSPVEVHPLFLNPVITFSIVENWDLDFVGQLSFNKEEKYKSPVQGLFGRIKWSF